MITSDDNVSKVYPESDTQKTCVRKKFLKDLATDHDTDELVILTRYHDMINILNQRLPNKDEAVKNPFAGGGHVDFSVTYAVAGNEYFDEMQTHLNYTVLHAALLLTVTLPAFLQPNEFSNSTDRHAFIILMGIASVANLFSIMFSTVFSTALLRPYKAADTMVSRIKFVEIFVWSVVTDYVGVITLLAAVIVAGFEFSDLDGYIMLVGLPLAVYLIYQWITTSSYSSYSQRENVKHFRAVYLDDEGFLLDKYLSLIGVKSPDMAQVEDEAKIENFLRELKLEFYLDNFLDHFVEFGQLKSLDYDLLSTIGVSKVGHQIKIIKAIESM